MILREAIGSDRGKVRALYHAAFPAEERPPFFLFMDRAKKRRADLLVAEENSRFIGFACLLSRKEALPGDPAYLFFLAVEEKERGMGYGGKILNALKERYAGRRIFLAREQLDPAAENYEERLKRHEFYLKNGFSDLPCRIREAGVTYDCMGVGGPVAPEEYKALISHWAGPLIQRFVDMRLLEGNGGTL